ncbi:MAG: DUF2442 domain-containing protein [Pyrinomonadaceae bacterium]
MKSKIAGKATLDVEVTHIDMQGIWLLMHDKEFFLPFERFPWFRKATVAEIHNVQVVNGDELYWPELNKNLLLSSIGNGNPVPIF